MAFDLDDEELKATRKLNGIDKDIGSIEEDIKILEDLTEWIKEEGIEACGMEKELPALEHLIKAYKDLKEELETEQNERLLCHIREKQMIPVQKVEETIEKYQNKIDKLYNQKVWNEPMDTIYKNRYVNYINILQELLEKRK